MGRDFFRRLARVAAIWLASGTLATAADDTTHGIAMYGAPALPPDFVSLPYANPDAPRGGRLVVGNTGGFDSLNPFVPKGTPPWQWRFLGYESLLTRTLDEPFTLYGLLAESVRTAPDRSWVEFTLNPDARFWDGSPVTVEDVLWSYETLGTVGHLRYRSLWSQIERIEATGPRSLRLSFKGDNRELALIAGLRPILKKAQWADSPFAEAALDPVPTGTGPYRVARFEAGRVVVLERDPGYWGRDLPIRRGVHNLDEIVIEFYGDASVLFEAFKAGELNAFREFNAEAWATRYAFPAVARGEVVLSEIPHGRPSGMTGFVLNTRRAPLDDWRVRDALLLAFNFEYINDTMTGGAQPRITSYFSNSHLAHAPGPAPEDERALLAPFADSLPPGALDGYALPVSDGSARNRANLRAAADRLEEAGWRVADGRRVNDAGETLRLEVVLRQSDTEMQTAIDLYARALERLGIDLRITRIDDAQFTERESAFDFDITTFRRDLSLSPGNEQRLYWGSESAAAPGSRNLMGVASPAIDAMIDTMLAAESEAEFRVAVRALDRILTAGRYVIPIWQFDVGRIAHARQLRFPERLPVYGDIPGFMPDVWWWED